jgi:Putative MetA-pathway of phenol degradation
MSPSPSWPLTATINRGSPAFGDTRVRLKHRLVDVGSRLPALMAVVSARLPTGDQDRALGADGVDVQPLVVASTTLGPVILTINAGYTFAARGREFDVVNVNTSGEALISKSWSIVGEVVSEVATSGQVNDRIVIRAGAVYAIGKRLKLDAAAGLGAT